MSELMSEFFRDRMAVIATMHRKELVIAPILSAELGVHIQVPLGFNTDQFGTFTREVPRPGTQLDAAIAKANAALDQVGETLAIASEGSFGPHPTLPYLALNRELVVLVDRRHALLIVGEATSTQTNYQSHVVDDRAAAEAIASQMGFPEHGLVVRSEDAPAELLVKGVSTAASLSDALDLMFGLGYRVRLETDMRAMYNPTRMAVIAEATRDLVTRAQSHCPQCGYPGFAIQAHHPGLPCGWCFQPTSLTLAVVYHCQHCGYQQESKFPDGVATADPQYCQFCNP